MADQPQRRPQRPQGNQGNAGSPYDKQIVAQRAKTVGDLIEQRRKEFERVVPKHVPVDRLLRVGLSAISRQPLLLACEPQSLLRGMMQASVLGLELDVLGEAYLVPFRNMKRGGIYEATFIPGYKGLIKLMRQSRDVESVHPGFAREGDRFDYDTGDRAFIKHRKALLAKDATPGAAIAYYCAIRTKGASYPQVTVMSPFEVEQIRLMSKAKDSGPWKDHYDQMGVKTVIRQAAKYAPSSSNLARALASEDRIEAGQGSADNRDLFPELDGVEEILDVDGPAETDGPNAPPEQRASTADSVAEKLGARDDIAFETREEEQARIAREKKQGAREPGSDG